MRFLRPTLVVASVLAAYGIVQAVVTARELASVRPTTIQPSLPLTELLAKIGFAVTATAYALLGWILARRGCSAGLAARRGALAGAIAGIVTDVAQAPVESEYFRAVGLAYGLNDALAASVALVALLLRPIAGAAIGALLTWLAALVLAPRRAGDTT